MLMLQPPPIPQLLQFWPLLVAQLPPVGDEQHVVLYDLHHFRLSVGCYDATQALQSFASSARRVASDPLVVLPETVREVLLGTRVVFAEHPGTGVTSALRLEGSRVVELSDELAALGAHGMRLTVLLKLFRAQTRGFARAAGVAAALTVGVWLLSPGAVAVGLAGLLEIARVGLPIIAASLLGAAIQSALAHTRHRAALEHLKVRIEILA